MKRFFVCALLLAALAGLGFYCFYGGRAYDILVDNHDITLDGKAYLGDKDVNVFIDGGEPLEMVPQDTMVVTVAGPKHTIKVEILNEDYEPVKTLEGKFSVTSSKKVFLSVPSFAGKAPGWQLIAPPEK